MAFTAQEWESIEEGQAVCTIDGPGQAPKRDLCSKVGQVTERIEDRWGRYFLVKFEDGSETSMHSVREPTERAIGYYLLEEDQGDEKYA